MKNDIFDIIHKLTFKVNDDELTDALIYVKRSVNAIEQYTKRQEILLKNYKKAFDNDDVKGLQRIGQEIAKNSKQLDRHKKIVEDMIVSDKKFNQALNSEIGIVQNLENRLKLLTTSRRNATSKTEIDRYNKLISETKSKIELNKNQKSLPTGGGLLSGLRGGALFKTASIAGLAIGIAQITKQVGEVTQKFEKYRSTLQNTFQSSVKASDELQKIKDFSTKASFGVDELTESYIKLANRGFEPTEEQMQSIGDLAASQGKSFEQLTESILDAQSGQFRRLKEFGIHATTVGDKVIFTFRGIEKQVKKTDVQAIRGAILSFGQLQGVVGSMESQTKTLSGSLSSLHGSLDNLFSAIGSHGNGVFKTLVDNLKETVDWFTKMVETSPADSLREQQTELNNLVSELIVANDQEGVRSSIMSEIASKYPEFLSFIDAENSSTTQLSSALSVLNQEYENKIRLSLLSEKQNDVTKRQTELIKKQREAIKSLLPELKKYGYDELSFSRLSPTQQQKVGSKIFQKIAKSKEDKVDEAKKYGTIVNYGQAKYEEYKAKEFKKRWDNFQKTNILLNKERIYTSKLVNAQNESYISGLKETLKEEEKNLEVLKKKKADQKEIAAQEKLIQGIKDKINPPKPKEINLPEKQKKAKKQKKEKDPNKLALEELDKQMKYEQELEKQRFEKKKKALLTSLETELIDRETYSNRLKQAIESNNNNLLKIELKYAYRRPKYLKKAEREANNTRIAEIKNSFKEYSEAIKERSEKIIKDLLLEQKNVDDEIFKLNSSSRDQELEAVDRFYKQRTTEIDKENKKLVTAQKNLEEDLKSKDPIIVSTAQKQLEQVNKNIEKYEDLRIGIIEDSRKKERDINLKYNLQEIKDYEEIALHKIDVFTQSENNRFNKVYGAKIDENQIILDTKRNNVSDKEIPTNIANRKRLKLEKEHAKEIEEIANRTEISKQVIIKNSLEIQLEILRKGLLELTDVERKEREKQIALLETMLSDSQKKIQSSFDNISKKGKDENQKWQDSFIDLAYTVAQAANTMIQAMQQANEEEINIRQGRVERAKEIAERGNADIYKIEEDRLKKAQAQQQRYARQQMAINGALATSQAIVAVTKVASEQGLWSIAGISAMVAAIFSGFQLVKTLTQSESTMPGFKDGVVDIQGAGTSTSDSIPVRLSKGESVVTAKATKSGDNAKIIKKMNEGIAFKTPNFNFNETSTIEKKDNNNDIQTFKEIKEEVRELKNIMSNQRPSTVTIDANGLAAISNAIAVRNRRRELL